MVITCYHNYGSIHIYTHIYIYTCTISEATVRPHSCLFKHRLIWHEGSLEVISAGVEHVRKILPSGYLT